MEVAGDVKCYHCGHVSGQVQGTRTDRLILHSFSPRPGYEGTPPRAGERIRCERCKGPVFLEDLQPVAQKEPIPMPTKSRRSRSKKQAA